MQTKSNYLGNLPWMQSRALKKTSRLIVVSTEHAHDPDAQYLQGEIRQFRRYHPDGVIVSIGSRRTLSRQFFAESTLLPMIPHLDQEDICILEEEVDLSTGNVSPNTIVKLLNDFSEQRTSAKRLKWIKGIAVAMFLLALTAAGFWWRATNAQHAAQEQARIAESRRLAAESTSALTQYPQRSLLLAVEAAKLGQSLPKGWGAPAEESLRAALAFVGGRPLVTNPSAIIAIGISPNNRWLVVESLDGTAWLWDLTAKDPAARPVMLHGLKGEVTALAISLDSHWLVTGGVDRTARLWDLTAQNPGARPAVVLESQGSAVEAVGISQDNHRLVTEDQKLKVRLWDLTAQDPAANVMVMDIIQQNRYVIKVKISPDGRWVVTGSRDGMAWLWDLTAQDPAAHPVVLLEGQGGEVTALAIGPNSDWLVIGSRDGTVRLWDLTAQDPAVLRGHEGPVTALAISLDSHWLVTGSLDGTARLWDLTAQDPAARPTVLRGHDGPVWALAIGPDHHLLVTGGQDKTARLWDLTSEDLAVSPAVLRGHEGAVTALAIGPDHHWLVTGGQDKTARLWDLTARDPAVRPVVLRGHEGAVTALAISADGNRPRRVQVS
jgi:WD40 repeat protein